MILGGNSGIHRPVMAGEVVDLLVTVPDGAYIDLTVGSGGHLKAIARAAGPKARLFGVDVDPMAVTRAKESLEDCQQRVEVLHASYDDLAAVADRVGTRAFDGILLDLGLSTDQLDDAQRGFAFRFDGPLDMRFDPQSGDWSAADLINSVDEKELTEIIRDFGEERMAPKLARAIVRERRTRMIRTTSDLAQIVTTLIRPPHQNKSLARVFQAFRIAVNHELEKLSRLLPIALSKLTTSGRLAVISYHSLEDRIVKRFFLEQAKGCICPPKLPVCICNRSPSMKIITRRPVVPQVQEKSANPHSRSAKLRVAERIAQ